jgi:hypothetical protein
MGGSGGEGHLPPNTIDMIEVQSGTYVGEENIVRFPDDFKRVQGKG